MHHHGHDYVWVTLGAADIENQVQGKPSARLQFKDGETRFTAGNFSHMVRDLAPTPFRNITVELLQDEKSRNAPSAWDTAKNEDRGLQVLSGGTKQILFVKDGVRVSELELQPGAVIPSHHHNGPHLVVAITDFDLRSDIEGKKPVSLHAKAGDANWVTGGYTHTVTNDGKQVAKFTTIEFP
jgi:quercetin dioxygenase-like cupin family protein